MNLWLNSVEEISKNTKHRIVVSCTSLVSNGLYVKASKYSINLPLWYKTKMHSKYKCNTDGQTGA